MENIQEKPIKTIKNLIDSSVEKYANHTAITFVNDNPISYSELGSKVKLISNYLQNNEINNGDKIAILGENSPNLGIAYLATTTIGAIAVPILPEFQSQEIANILKHSEAKILFVSEKLFKNIPDSFLTSENQIILLKNFNIIPLGTTSENLNISSYSTIYDNSSNKDDFKGKSISEDEIATIIYTSGTTGSSKGVMLSHKNIIANVYSSTKILDIGTNDRFLSILPMSHTYENTLGFLFPLMMGSTIYYLGQMPTANILIAAMQKVKPTIMLSVPLIIEKIYKMSILKKFQANSVIRFLYKIPVIRKFLNQLAGKKLLKTFGGELRFFGIGGAPLSPEVEEFLIEAKFPYAIGYGLTETSPLLAGTNPQKSKYRSTGPAVDQVQIKINNPDKNGEGEIFAKGSNVMLGYYKDKEKTDEVFTSDGWFKTGDLGVLDEDNYLFIKGRLKNMILGPSGENIYPEEIEATLNKYKYVAESLVFEEKGKLIAKVHLNFEELEEQFNYLKESAHHMQEKINDIINDIHFHVNLELNKFSRLNLLIVQTEPFEKTPTKKIKRYLYT